MSRLEGKVDAQQGQIERQQQQLETQQGLIEAQKEQLGTLRQLIESMQALITSLTNRLAALDGGSAAATPTATPTTTVALEATLTPTPTSTTIPTATPTRTSASTLAPGCIRSISLGWLTGAWNSDCLSNKTPPTAKTGTRYARFYTFTLDAPSSVTVNITSNDVADAYLYMLNGRGNAGSIVNRGDAQISETLQPGAYTIEATTYNLETGGNFTLTFDVAGLSRIR